MFAQGVCLGGVCPRGSAQGECLPTCEVSAQGGCLPGGCTPPPLWTDRHLSKYNLSATSVADGKKPNEIERIYWLSIFVNIMNNLYFE